MADDVEALSADLSQHEDRLIRARARAERWTRLLILFGAATLAACLGLIVFLLVQVNHTQAALESCTVPGRPCYERSMQQSSAIVARLITEQQQAVQDAEANDVSDLKITQANAERIKIALGILDRQYPEAAAAVRAELQQKEAKP